MLTSSVGIWFLRTSNSSQWPSQRLARAWLRGSNFNVLPFLIVDMSLSCPVASVIVDLSVSITFSRSMLLDSGAPSRSLVGRCWIADVNPTSWIRGHVNPENLLFLVLCCAVLISILHRCWLSPGVELSFPAWVWPACWCSLTAFLDNISAGSKCILSCLPGVISLAPFSSFSVVNIFRLYFRCRLEVEVKLVVPFAR